MLRKTLVLSVAAVLIVSFAVSIPASNGLIQRDFNFLNDQHLTARTGNYKVCGDHICARGEWQATHEKINNAQLHNKGNSTTSTNMWMSTNIPIQTRAPLGICQTVKTTLTEGVISSTVIAKVMADLGCI